VPVAELSPQTEQNVTSPSRMAVQRRAPLDMPGEQKCAILLISLGSVPSAKLLRELPEEEVERISREMIRLPMVPQAQVEAVLEEFSQYWHDQRHMVEGGLGYTKRTLADAFGEDSSRTILERALKSTGADAATFDRLQKVDPRQLAKLVYNEHPQIIALVLSRLVAPKAAALLQALPAELRPDVAKRMASLDQLSPEIIARIAAFIDRRLRSLGEFNRESYGGVRAVAEMLNGLDHTASDELLANVAQDEPALAETIRNLMFVWEDMVSMDQESIRTLLPQVDRKALAIALKGSSAKMTTLFTQVMSQGAAEMLVEDIEALGPVKIRDVQSAQQQIIAVVRDLQTRGVIGQHGDGGGEYV
jgi:flagellar motor switch protein FliG